ncbi:MAG: alkaline phosphatase D family protein [Flavobacteriales bacterium]|nr:alkaline phosphatase D family protein [Flavobacteriales bacterium]
MYRILLSALLLIGITGGNAYSQTTTGNQFNHGRSDLDAELAPFYHGVASGDPLPDAVIIWTRITLPDADAVNVNWRMATDTLFGNVVASGTVTTDATTDWTVQVDVTGLEPDSWYYYQFLHDGVPSIMGRTHTAPVGGVEHLRFGVVSCSNYEHGLFNAYRSLAERNDIDAVLHLGDYIYEYEVGGYSINMEGRTNEPANEIITLEDYRTRYSHYRLDADLREIHRQYPFIVIWDDHETANDSWYGGANNHTEGAEGLWVDRKAAAIRAHDEWLPLRRPDANSPERIYRDFSYGSMADLLMLDTRLYARELQGALGASTRVLLGYEQRHWLYDNLSASEAKWKIIGQQVMVAPMLLAGIPVNNDQWDGYTGERDSLYSHLLDNSIDNAVVLTGDIHTSWANDLRRGATLFNPGIPVAVEFVVTSITSTGFPFNVGAGIIQSSNQHVKYIDLTQHGYLILDLTDAAAQSDWYYISSRTEPVFTTAFAAGWKTNDGDNFLSQANGATVGGVFPPLAPAFVADPVGGISLGDRPDGLIVSAYPNPFDHDFTVQFNAFKAERVTCTLTDASGRTVLSRDLGTVPAGLHYLDVNAPDVAPGLYILSMTIGDQRMVRNMMRR